MRAAIEGKKVDFNEFVDHMPSKKVSNYRCWCVRTITCTHSRINRKNGVWMSQVFQMAPLTATWMVMEIWILL